MIFISFPRLAVLIGLWSFQFDKSGGIGLYLLQRLFQIFNQIVCVLDPD